MVRFTLLTFLFCLCLPLHAQSLIKHQESSEPLADKWEWAMDQGGSGTYWVGYRFNKLMGRREFYGSFTRGAIDEERSLYALIGEREKFDTSLSERASSWNFRGSGTIRINGGDKGVMQELVLKEIAVLVNYDKGMPVQVVASNMTMEFDLDGDLLYWLDHAELQESIGVLIGTNNKLKHNDAREDLVTVLGLHGQHIEIEAFVSEILRGTHHSDIRERAAYVLGQQNTKTALGSLHDVIREDASEDVREHAVYAVSQMTLEGAQDLLIDLARNERNDDVREKAIYGLGRKASRKALDALEETILDDANVEVQKHAVHALGQFDPDTALPRLIEIANNHSSREVRKRAIYMLGNIGTEQAVEALIEIVEKH